MAVVRENEEKKRYLNGYRDCTRRERQLQEQIEELRSQQMFPSVNHDGMPQGNAHSDLSGYVARLDALISQLEHEQAMAVRQYKEIHDRIHKMQDGAEKEVLIRRYLMGRTWEQIAVEMDYTYRHVTRLHGAALRRFCLPEEEKGEFSLGKTDIFR